jgi:hypothetical protein
MRVVGAKHSPQDRTGEPAKRRRIHTAAGWQGPRERPLPLGCSGAFAEMFVFGVRAAHRHVERKSLGASLLGMDGVLLAQCG